MKALTVPIVRLATIATLPCALIVGQVTAADLSTREVTETLFKSKRGTPIDFSGKDLSFLDLSGLDFKGAKLASVNLYGADLTDANLTGSDLSGARLDRATVVRADFSGANLEGASLLGPTAYSDVTIDQGDAPRFIGANLRKLRIAGRLDGSKFRGADMTGAVIGQQRAVWGSYKPRASMNGADFTGAMLVNIDLSETDLLFARFVSADLSRANLKDADLSMADLTHANLAQADLSQANLDGAKLSGVKGLETATGLASAQNLDKAIR